MKKKVEAANAAKLEEAKAVQTVVKMETVFRKSKAPEEFRRYIRAIVDQWRVAVILLLNIYAGTLAFAGDGGIAIGIPVPKDLGVVEIGGAILGIYEIVARLVPTVKDWSLLSNAMKFLGWMIPNRRR